VVQGRSSRAAAHTCYERLRPDPTPPPGFLSRTFCTGTWSPSPRRSCVA